MTETNDQRPRARGGKRQVWVLGALFALTLFGVPAAHAYAAPDLTADPVTSNGDINRNAYETLTFTTMVRNIGNQTAYPSPYLKTILQVQNYANGAVTTVLGEYSKGNPNPGYYTQICTLSACPVYEMAYWTGGPGSYRARFCADIDLSGLGTVTENDENNNCGAWVNVNMAGSSPMPNLYMDSFVDYGQFGSPAPNPRAGMPVMLGSSIYNNGNADSGPLYALFQMADTSSGTNVVDLGNKYWPEGVEQQSASWGSPWIQYTFPTAGTKYLRACADKSSASDPGMNTESNESDNCGPWMSVVIGATPTMSCTVSATTANVGQSVTYTFSAQNAATTPYYLTSSDGLQNNYSTSASTFTRSFSSTGSKTMTVKGTYNSNQGLVATTAAASCPTVTVGPAAQPDLTVGSLTPTTATAGVNFTLSVPVTNSGAASTGAGFTTQFEISYASNGSPAYVMGSHTMAALAQGASGTATLPITNPDAGTFYIRACTDNGGAIAESNEGNNCTAWTMVVISTATTPDLTAGSVTPTTATAGVAVTLSSTIANGGTGSTGAAFTSLFQVANDASGTGVTDIGTFANSTLGAGASAVATRSYTFASAGTKYVRACADKASAAGTGTITESNESNNCSAWTAVTIGAAAQPDLTAANIAQTTAVARATTTLTSVITNGGAATTGAGFSVLFQVSDDNGVTHAWDMGYGNVAALGPGGTGTASFSLAPDAGTWYVRACADKTSSASTGVITESNESNNCSAWTTIVVTASGQPDLTAGATSPTTGTEGVPVTINAPISNIGSASTGAGFTVLFQVATDSSGTGASTLGTGSVSAVAAGGNATASFTMTPTAGTYYGRACADKNSGTDPGVITESNESNNCGPWTMCVIAAPAAPSVSCNVSDTSVEIGESVTYTTSVAGGSPTAPYTWTASDSASGLGTGSTATRSFSAAGDYDMLVKASNTANASCPRVTVAAPACAGPASLDVTSSPARVQQGNTVTLAWSGSNIPSAVTSCTLTGTGVSETIPVSASPACGISGSVVTPAVTTQTTYTLTCGSATDTVIVNVLPKFEYF